MADALLDHPGQAPAWANQPVWRILDTRFDPGQRFLSHWLAWQRDPQRPRCLHYVALTPQVPDTQSLLALALSSPQFEHLAPALASQCFGLLPGFQRLAFEDGQVMLTLCVGETLGLLRQQQFEADSLVLDLTPYSTPALSTPALSTPALAPTGDAPWTLWSSKALARCSRHGTRLAVACATPQQLADLRQCGFEPDAAHTHADPVTGFAHYQYHPRWTIKHSRSPLRQAAAAPGTCAVVGAGVAGASVAAALARRGWQVQVLDQAQAPAAGASGLPVGLVVPHVSTDDCSLSRLSRAGVRLMLQQAQLLLSAGTDWAPTGTQERSPDGNPAQWHAHAAWLKPAALIKAWLRQPGVQFQGNSQVMALRRAGDARDQWELLGAQGQLLARAQRVVLANALDARRLVASLQALLGPHAGRERQMAALHGMHGQLSWGMHQATDTTRFAPYPVNGAGSLVAHVPTPAGPAWFVGSSYTPAHQQPPSPAQLHAYNLERLHSIFPLAAQALAPRFAAGEVTAWANTRCVTADRLPLLGPLDEDATSGLWICAGMGSRGLSLSVLCAELLAARWNAEPLPIDAPLATALYALRGGSSAIMNAPNPYGTH